MNRDVTAEVRIREMSVGSVEQSIAPFPRYGGNSNLEIVASSIFSSKKSRARNIVGSAENKFRAFVVTCDGTLNRRDNEYLGERIVSVQ